MEIVIHVKSELELITGLLWMNPMTLSRDGVAKKANTILGFIPRSVEFHSRK